MAFIFFAMIAMMIPRDIEQLMSDEFRSVSAYLKTAKAAIVFLSFVLPGGAMAGPSCKETLGPAQSQELVDQCLNVSPATHPPCNASNSCDLIIGEIKRGCAMLTSDAPAYCRKY